MSVHETTSHATRTASDPDGLRWSRGSGADAGVASLLASRAFDPHFRESWTEGQIEGLLRTASGWLELGQAPGALVAFALCRRTLDEVELLLCAVDPDWRGQGIGRQLMHRVAEGARTQGATRLFLEVRSSNTAALALYRSFGFETAGRRPAYYRTVSGESIDALTLSLHLN